MSSDQNEPDEYIIDTKHLKVSTRIVVNILLWGFVLFMIYSLFLSQWLGDTNLGSFWQKSNYQTQYWVYLQPENANDKNYRLKGDITKDDNGYTLTKVYWSNGGYSTFDDCNLDSAVSDKDTANCSTNDENSDNYTIRLGDKV